MEMVCLMNHRWEGELNLKENNLVWGLEFEVWGCLF